MTVFRIHAGRQASDDYTRGGARMATVNLTKDAFQTTVDKEGIVLVDWWASWCGPCRQFGPIFERVSEKHPDATFAKVDTEAESELSGAFGIRSIPTLMIFR